MWVNLIQERKNKNAQKNPKIFKNTNERKFIYWTCLTDDLNKQIQNVMFNYSDAFYIEKLEDLLSDIFDTKVEHITCSIRSKSFALSFTGKKVFLAIIVNF